LLSSTSAFNSRDAARASTYCFGFSEGAAPASVPFALGSPAAGPPGAWLEPDPPWSRSRVTEELWSFTASAWCGVAVVLPPEPNVAGVFAAGPDVVPPGAAPVEGDGD
jgi:hypothetical protein